MTLWRPPPPEAEGTDERGRLKWQFLLLAAGTDRGQAHNPTSGSHYSDRMAMAKEYLRDLIDHSTSLPESLEEIDGEWELVFSTLKHGIFRSSPFWLAVQEALNGSEMSDMVFRLTDIQANSWGLSKSGRVAQYINSTEGRIYSEVDVSLLPMTSIPFVGFWKLFPTFGGCVTTVADVVMKNNRLEMQIDYAEAKPVPGLPPLADWVLNRKIPLGSVWQLLPWNNGRKSTCSLTVKYMDEDMYILADADGELFVYVRPADPRGL